jgi:TrpR family trp operon transcriptional repressor
MQPLDNHCRDLASFVLSSGTVEELAHVLRAVLTPAEIESISQRLSILDGISTGIAQREIAESLRVGIATVTRGSRVWQENRDCLGKYLPRARSGEAVVASLPSAAKPSGNGAAAPASLSASTMRPVAVVSPAN